MAARPADASSHIPHNEYLMRDEIDLKLIRRGVNFLAIPALIMPQSLFRGQRPLYDNGVFQPQPQDFASLEALGILRCVMYPVLLAVQLSAHISEAELTRLFASDQSSRSTFSVTVAPNTSIRITGAILD
jgi:hypothetical protein